MYQGWPKINDGFCLLVARIKDETTYRIQSKDSTLFRIDILYKDNLMNKTPTTLASQRRKEMGYKKLKKHSFITNLSTYMSLPLCHATYISLSPAVHTLNEVDYIDLNA
jgi:hypothetical protein